MVTDATSRHNTDADEQKKIDQADRKAKLIILFSLSDDVQPFIRDSSTTKDVGDKLNMVYEAKNQNQIMNLQSQLHSLKMKNGEQLESFLKRIAELRASLQAL